MDFLLVNLLVVNSCYSCYLYQINKKKEVVLCPARRRMTVYRTNGAINSLHGNKISVQQCYLDDWHKFDEFGLGSLVHREITYATRLLNLCVLACFGLV